MNKLGYLLIQVLLGITILGIISITFMPIFTNIYKNFLLLESKNNMKCIAESIVEKLKAFNYKNTNDEYIFDINMVDLIDMFHKDDNVKVKLPTLVDSKLNYYVIIKKENNSEKLWYIKVTVVPTKQIKRLSDVNFSFLLQKPTKK